MIRFRIHGQVGRLLINKNRFPFKLEYQHVQCYYLIPLFCLKIQQFNLNW